MRTLWMIFKTHPVIAELEVLGKVATDGMGPPERGQSPSFCPTLINSDNETSSWVGTIRRLVQREP